MTTKICRDNTFQNTPSTEEQINEFIQLLSWVHYNKPKYATMQLLHPVSVSVEAKLSFVEPGRRRAHSPFLSKAPGISYQGTMSKTSRDLQLLYGASFCFLRPFR